MLPFKIFRRFIAKQGKLKNKSSIVDWELKSLISKNDAVLLEIQNEANSTRLLIPFAWLRDHCKTHNFHAATNQRKNNMMQISRESQIEDASSASLQSENDTFSIRWKDGKISTFSIDDILNNSAQNDTKVVNQKKNNFIQQWDSTTLKSIPQIQKENLSIDAFCLNFLKYGVVIVSEVEANAEKTEELCKSILAITDTFFGEFWVFSNELKEDEGEKYHEDTAYGDDEIGPHVDGTYFENNLGIQVFHCLHPAEKGGETTLIDGFKAAEILKEQFPESYEILTKYKIAHHYIENGETPKLHAISKGRPVIELDHNENICNIRYNPYDRASMQVLDGNEATAAQTILFYQAYERFARILSDPKLSISIHLQPGQVIFIDNTRVMHSRTSFTGYRQMCGCYMSKDDLLAKARPFLPDDVKRII